MFLGSIDSTEGLSPAFLELFILLKLQTHFAELLILVGIVVLAAESRELKVESEAWRR
jgi:hypothetical protein